MNTLHSILWWVGFTFFIFVLSLMPPIRGFFVDAAKELARFYNRNQAFRRTLIFLSVIVAGVLGEFLYSWLTRK